MATIKKCVVCGRAITNQNGHSKVCSDECREIRTKQRDKDWKKNNPEKYRAQLDRINGRARAETEAANNVKVAKFKPPTFKDKWKKADKLTQDTMIANFWRDHRDSNMSYGKYSAMKETWPEMHREIRRYVLLCNGIDEDKEVITSNKNLCAICGKTASEMHHLVFGRGIRPLADEDGLVMPVCRACHDLIHGDAALGTMSKMLGQLQYEKEHPDKGREGFRARYGRSWL